MNESLDLRNRINKMRSINNLETNEDKFSKHLKIDQKKLIRKRHKKMKNIFRKKLLKMKK